MAKTYVPKGLGLNEPGAGRVGATQTYSRSNPPKVVNNSTGQLDTAIGQGPDASYLAFQKRQQSLASEVTKQKQQQEQQKTQVQKAAKQNALQRTAGKVGSFLAGNVVKPLVNTAELPYKTGELAANALVFGGHSTEAQQNTKNLGNTYTKSVPGAVTSPFVDVAKEANKSIVQPIIHTPKTSGPPILKLQSQVQAAVKSGKFAPETVQMINKTHGGRTMLAAIADPNATDKSVQAALKGVSKTEKTQNLRALGDILQISSTAVGAPETAGVVTGAKPILKAAITNTAAGAVGNVGSQLSTNPNASAKELVKSGAAGAGFGLATTALGETLHKINPLSDVKSRFNEHVSQYITNKSATTAAETEKSAAKSAEGMSRLNAAEAKAKSEAAVSEKLKGPTTTALPAGKTQKLLAPPKSALVSQSAEDKRIADGTEVLAKQYTKEYKKVVDTWSGSPKRLQAEVSKLDDTYIAKHEALLNDVGGVNATKVATPARPKGSLKPLGQSVNAVVDKDLVASKIVKPEIAHVPADSLLLGSDALGSEIDKKTVAQYKADIKAGKPVEPIVVSREKNGQILVQDGKHRLEAMKQAGVSDIPVVERAPKTERVVTPEVKTPLKPVGEGEVKTSGLAKGVEAKAVEKKLTNNLGELPEYKTVNMKEQAQQATDLLAQDEERATRIATGVEDAPKGLIPEAVFTAVEDKALRDGSVDMLKRLANSSRTTEATAMGQRIRALAERNPDSAVGAIKQVADARASAVERKLKQPVSKAINTTVKEIQSNIKKPSKMDWSMFVESIKC